MSASVVGAANRRPFNYRACAHRSLPPSSAQLLPRSLPPIHLTNPDSPLQPSIALSSCQPNRNQVIADPRAKHISQPPHQWRPPTGPTAAMCRRGRRARHPNPKPLHLFSMKPAYRSGSQSFRTIRRNPSLSLSRIFMVYTTRSARESASRTSEETP